MMHHRFPTPQIHQGSQLNPSKLKQLLTDNPIPSTAFQYEYGTAGFRYHHSILNPIMVRMGILSCLYSASINGEGVGVMVTASHNPENDNGVKLADSNGGMLPLKWESMATKIANAHNDTLIEWIYEEMQNTQQEGEDNRNVRQMVVHIGRDTRSHSRALSLLTIQTIVAMGGTVIDHGLVTTPQLHYYVLRSNLQNMPSALLAMSSGLGFERDYIEGMIGAYLTLIGTSIRKNKRHDIIPTNNNKRRMFVDCACGVGGLKVPILNSFLRQYDKEGGTLINTKTSKHNRSLHEAIDLIPFNLPGDGPLNERCGAEYVQKQQLLPRVYTKGFFNSNDKHMDYVASLDGDADRIVFHYKDKFGKLVLLDGDKIAVLVSSFLQEELDLLSVVVKEAKDVRCGVVQTAYANGSSTNYLKNVVKTNVIVAKTGVKYVHSAAHANFDVGTYFEANGHGTVLFGPKFYDVLAKAEAQLIGTCRFSRSNIAWQRLRMMPRLVNQAVGDALSDLLLVDAILYLKGWTLKDWNCLYTDLPSRQCKVKVKDRSLIQTNDNETKATHPISLQPALENASSSLSRQLHSSPVGYHPTPRIFVRPSGTENVVRIYAEASTQKDADALASETAAIVFKLCDGIGDIPFFSNRSNL